MQTLPWIHPLALAETMRDPYWVLLYSGVQASYSGRYSYLACDLAERVEGTDFSSLEAKLTTDRGIWDNAWFGYLGYGLKDCLETLTTDRVHCPKLPNLWMMRFNIVYRFDHELQSVTMHSEGGKNILPETGPLPDIYLPGVSSLASNMSRKDYLEKAAHIIECIRKGDLYQANLTRKWMGIFEQAPKPFDVFKKLCITSPAPYSAFLQLGENAIASSSPELFLRFDANGAMRARPIKGTAPRDNDPARDRVLHQRLAASPKDRAENLMIVDLMRNDFSRSCFPGSVRADQLFEVTSHFAVHHMSSTITGMKRPDCGILKAIKHSFPPGSMTGAPKITAMNLCSRLEEIERGVYSGAIGWLGGDGSGELSVAIRTLIMRGDRFEFQVGGGIVADSTPEAEHNEIIDKSRGIAATLGIPIEEMQKI